MLIFDCNNSSVGQSKSTSNGKKNKRKGSKKGSKKGYESVGCRKKIRCSIKSVEGGRSKKKSKVPRRKKNISKKNVKFLEDLGLKVKKQ